VNEKGNTCFACLPQQKSLILHPTRRSPVRRYCALANDALDPGAHSVHIKPLNACARNDKWRFLAFWRFDASVSLVWVLLELSPFSLLVISQISAISHQPHFAVRIGISSIGMHPSLAPA